MRSYLHLSNGDELYTQVVKATTASLLGSLFAAMIRIQTAKKLKTVQN